MEMSVLIAIGDERSRNTYRRLLSSCGYEVESASGGLECLTKLNDPSPDVLVLDAQLDWGRAGGIVARWRDEQFPNLVVPVVLITPDLPGDDECDLIVPPHIWRLGKPFRPSALLEAICRAGNYYRQGSTGSPLFRLPSSTKHHRCPVGTRK
jgi:CheY-like chemotaxis protein